MKQLLFTFFVFVPFLCFAQQTELQIPAKYQSSFVQPKSIIEKGNGHYFIDFGKDAFGALILNLKALQSDSLVIHLGEKLSDKNTLDRNSGKTIRYLKIVLKNIPADKNYQVQPAPDGRNDKYPAVLLPDSFGRIMPFRYCEIENLKIPIDQIEIKQKIFNYQFNEEASYFACSDSILNQVWDICKHTVKATSFAGYYIDGDRERIPYEADAFINQLSHYAVDSEYTLAERTNEYFIDHPTWPTEWILHTVLLFYYDYLYTGNTEFLTKYYDVLKSKTLMALEREDGLISVKSPKKTNELMKSVGFDPKYTSRPIEDIVDWPMGERDGYDMKANVNTVVNSFYYINLKLMSEIADVLGKKQDSKLFLRKSEITKNTINTKLFDSEKNIYIDGENSEHSSLHANMFPLAFGIVPEKYKEKVVKFIESRGIACSVYGAQYLLEGLYKAGEADYAMSLMNATEGNRNWWNMIREGSTMTMETWCSDCKWNTDWNHAWATAPANVISRYLWGIQPSEAGFGKVSINPQLGNLTWSKIKVPTIKGAITAEFKKEGNTYIYTIDLPKGMKGVFEKSNYSKNLQEGKNTIKVKSII